MKIKISSSEQGSMLIVTVVISAIIGLTLASYLAMVQAQHLNVMRSQAWNSAIPACEAGIEEALAHLNSIGTGDRATNGWVFSDGVYVKSGALLGAEYDVSISTADTPVVISYGYVPAPLGKGEISRAVRVVTSRQSTGMKGLVAKGSIALGPGSIIDSYDSRITLVYNPTTANSNAFVGAVAGNVAGGELIKGDVATGPGFTITSPHTGSASSDLSQSFPDVTDPFSGGFTPQSGTVTVTNFNVGSTTITTNTYPATEPPSGVITNIVTFTNTAPPGAGAYSTITISVTETTWPGTSVGTVTTNTTSITGAKFEPPSGSYIPPYEYGGTPKRYSYLRLDSYTYSATRYVYSATNYIYSDATTNSITTTTTTYAYVLDSENYKTDTISLSGSQSDTAEMLVRGDAVLWVTGGFTMTGNARVTILPGASLKIYVGDGEGSSAEIKIAGNGILNMSGDTEKMAIYGMSDNTKVKLAGNAGFVGTVYAPNAVLEGKGGGNDVDDLQGAAIVGSVAYNGHFNFHYDEKLGENGGLTQWKINTWAEF